MNMAFQFEATFCAGDCIEEKNALEVVGWTELKIIDFYITHRIIPLWISCKKCGAALKLNEKLLVFRCDKSNVNGERCRVKQSAKTGSWIHRSHLDIRKLFRFVFFYLTLKPPRWNIVRQYLGLAPNTFVDWANFIREVCIDYCARNTPPQIGGVGHVIEIDEAKIGRRKYNVGRIIEGQWIFGGIDRETQEVFLYPVKNRKKRTLLRLIRRRILPGTTIMSDCWKAYNTIGQENFEHFTVNHTVNFVDPDTGAHTNNIERLWREVRSNVPRYGNKKPHFVGYLAEFLFK